MHLLFRARMATRSHALKSRVTAKVLGSYRSRLLSGDLLQRCETIHTAQHDGPIEKSVVSCEKLYEAGFMVELTMRHKEVVSTTLEGSLGDESVLTGSSACGGVSRVTIARHWTRGLHAAHSTKA